MLVGTAALVPISSHHARNVSTNAHDDDFGGGGGGARDHENDGDVQRVLIFVAIVAILCSCVLFCVMLVGCVLCCCVLCCVVLMNCALVGCVLVVLVDCEPVAVGHAGKGVVVQVVVLGVVVDAGTV